MWKEEEEGISITDGDIYDKTDVLYTGEEIKDPCKTCTKGVWCKNCRHAKVIEVLWESDHLLYSI